MPFRKQRHIRNLTRLLRSKQHPIRAVLIWHVEENATGFTCLSSRDGRRSKSSLSFTLLAGVPTSAKSMQRLSKSLSIFSLSFTENDIPSACMPSRKVVSNISVFFIGCSRNILSVFPDFSRLLYGLHHTAQEVFSYQIRSVRPVKVPADVLL